MGNWYTKSVDTRVAQMFESVRQFNFKQEMKPKPFITIARQFGCDAYDIAGTLAEILTQKIANGQNWELYDKELVEKVAGDLKATESLIKAMAIEHRNAFEQFLSSMVLNIPNTDKIFKRMAEVIRGIAWHGNAIIIGRGSGILCHDMPEGLHINLVVPFKWRVKNIQRWQTGSELPQIEKDLSVRDMERNKFYQKYFSIPVDNFTDFDLTINNAKFDTEETARLVFNALMQKMEIDG